MRLEWIEDIVAVAEAGSFAEAAARRRLTPSAFSRRLRQIEAHLGQPLFDRTGKPARPLPALLERRERLEEVVGAIRELEADLRGPGAGALGPVIAITPALSRVLGARLVAGQAAARGLPLRFRVARRRDCIDMLTSRRARRDRSPAGRRSRQHRTGRFGDPRPRGRPARRLRGVAGGPGARLDRLLATLFLSPNP